MLFGHLPALLLVYLHSRCDASQQLLLLSRHIFQLLIETLLATLLTLLRLHAMPTHLLIETA